MQAIPISMTAQLPSWHWLPCSDGKRHAVLGREVVHQPGEVFTTLCGTVTATSEWKYAQFRHPTCLRCYDGAKEFLETADK